MKVERIVLDDRLTKDDVGYATSGAAGIDLRVCRSADGKPIYGTFTMQPGERLKVGTGIALDLYPVDQSARLAGLILPRSGIGTAGLKLLNTAGLLDEDYQGEIFLSMLWDGDDSRIFTALERVAQLVITPVVRIEPIDVLSFSRKTARGAGGFGSTGSH